MQWSDRELTDGYFERTIEFSSTTELNHFRRIIPGDEELPSTHRQELRYVPHPSDPKALPKLVIAPRPLRLADVAERTENFAKLEIRELQALVEREGITVKVEKGQDERAVTIEALRAALKNPKKAAAPATAEKPVMVPADLLNMQDADLEVKAARLGVQREWTQARRKSKAAGVSVIAQALAKREAEAVTA